MIKLDAVINDKKLLASIQKGVNLFNRSAAGKSKLNLKINEKGFRQPLGRITGDLDKFESALAASNARVIAFGASTAVIGGMTRAFKELAQTTVKVQKQFADINRILNVSNREFEGFSNSLFNIGKRTATTFDDAAKAALEFARQGLGLNETLKRTADALTLVRLTGVNADKAVSALTATVNAFQQSALTTNEALNKFVAVETKFAVSAKDLMDGLGRVGSAAVDAKVSFDELNAMVAAVQQQTGRGGAVIGNALKTIFTRLQRRDTLEALEQFNIEVQDMQGNILPAMAILQNFAKTYDTLSDANKSYLREQVAGVFQANILSAIVKDINSDFQVYNRALTTSTDATNEAAMANARLNQTISALLSQTGTELIRLQENVGKITFEPIARAILGPFKDLISNINNILDGEGLGSDFANGILKGIRNIVAGPGLVAAIAVIGKIFITTAGYIAAALPTLLGITTEKQKQAKLEVTIEAMLASDVNLTRLIAQNEGNAAVQAGLVAAAAKTAMKSHQASATATGLIATNLRMAGMTTTKAGTIVPGRGAFGRGARGYVPGFAGEAADVRRGVGGVSSTARPVHIPNFAFGGGQRGSMVANSGEYVVPNFKGGGSAIFNPAMVRANGGLPQGAKRITAAHGYVPNFAIQSPSAYLKGGGTLPGLYGGVKAGNISAIQVQQGAGGRSASQVNALTARAKREGSRRRGVGPSKLIVRARDVGVGAIVGMQHGAKRGYNPSTALSTLSGGKIVNPSLKTLAMRSPRTMFQLTGVPVGGINKLGGGKDKKAAERTMKQNFTSQLNNTMVPALGKYSSKIFSGLFKDDGKAFADSLLATRGKRVFSTSVEGGIMEAALQFAGKNASKFSGDDAARFDFEEAGKISKPLLDTFFTGNKWVVRADAKRSDSAANIRTLIAKSFGTQLTANRIARSPAVSSAIKALPKAAGGYIPNFAGGGLGAAISREKAAGVLNRDIRINSSPRFQSPWNPAGLAVTNTKDEPRGLKDVPNFADTDILTRAGVRLNTMSPTYAKSTALYNKALMDAAQDLSSERNTPKEFYKRMDVLSKEYKMTIPDAKKVKKATFQLAKQMRPGGGMGGLMALMMLPMVGGGIEQAVGGQTGAAISGGITGGVTGGWLGGMAGAAALSKLTIGGMGVGGPVGAGIGATIGIILGVSAALSATGDSAASLGQELQTLTGGLQRNAKAAMLYIQAQEDLAAAATEDELADAANRATIALESIGDTDLAEKFMAAGDSVEALTTSLEDWSVRQGIKIKMKGAQAGLLGVAEQTFEDDIETLLAIPKEKDREEAIRRKMRGATRGLVKLFMDPALFGRTEKGDRGAEPEEMRQLFKVLFAEGGSSNWGSPWGRLNESELRDLLTKQFGDKGMTGEMIAETARVLEAIDPGFWEYQAQDALMKFVKSGDLSDFYYEMFDGQTKGLTKSVKTQLRGVNYTRDFEELLRSISNTVLLYTEDLAIIAEQTAVRDATLNARKGFLGFRGGSYNLREARGVSAKNFEQRRQVVDRTLFNQNRGEILTNLKNVYKTPEGLRGDFADAMSGPGGFVQAGFGSGIDRLKESLTFAATKAPDAIEAMTKLITKLEAAYKEQMQGIEKDEKVQALKFKADQLRVTITREQFRLAILQSKNIHAEKMNLEKARGEFDLYKLRQQRTIDAPESMFGLTPMEQLQKRQTAETNIFRADRDLSRKQDLSEVRQQIIEAKTQMALNATTGKLVDTNLQLKDAINALNATLGGTPTEVKGVSPKSAHTKPKFPEPITTADAKVIMGPLAPETVGEETLDEWFLRVYSVDKVAEQKNKERAAEKAAYIEGRMSPAVRRGSEDQIERARGLFGRDFEKYHPKGGGVPPLLSRRVGAPGGFRPEVFNKETNRWETDPTRGRVPVSEDFANRNKKGGQPQSPAARQGDPAWLDAAMAVVSADFKMPKGLRPEQLKEIERLTEDINEAIAAGNVKDAKGTAEIREKTAEVMSLKNEIEGSAEAAHKLAQEFEDLDTQRATKFSAGLKEGFNAVRQHSYYIYAELGEKLPTQFRDNMVSALEAAMDKTQSLGDALKGVAIAFLTTMRQAFLQSAVSSTMNMLGVDTRQRGGFISAQGGRLVPGRGSGDKVPILAEPGEFVVNREAVNAVGAGNLNALNTAIPRFQAGGAMNLALKPDSPQLSGYFLSRGNAETEELADAALEKLQKAQQKASEKANMKNMLLSTLFSAALSYGMGALGSKFGSKKTVLGPGNKTMYRNVSRTGGTFYSEAGRAGAPELPTGWGPQRGGLLNNRAMQRYSLFQGGGSVPVAASAPALGGGNTNNININLDLSGGRGNAGDGRSQSQSGNSGAPASASATESDARALSEKIKAQVVKVIAEEQRVGGSLSPGARRG